MTIADACNVYKRHDNDSGFVISINEQNLMACLANSLLQIFLEMKPLLLRQNIYWFMYEIMKYRPAKK